MPKNVTIELSTNEINRLKEKVNTWSSMMKTVAKNYVSDMAEYSLQIIQKNYNQNPFKGNTEMDFFLSGTDFDKEVGMSGTQAIYEEFGTGTMGEQNPHPVKKEFGLNPYNDGSTIRKAKNEIINEETGEKIPAGELYWTFKDDSGEIVHTQGVPAGREVYDAFQSAKRKSPSIAKQRLEEVLK